MPAGKALGCSDVLGNPLGLIDSVGTGVFEFVRGGFGGIVAGDAQQVGGAAKALVRGVIGGATGSTAKLTGSLERLVRGATGTSRHRDDSGERASLLEDVARLGAGILTPMQGANSLTSFTRGVGSGLVGVVAAPLVGTLMVTTELLRTVHEHVQFDQGKGGQDVRVRPPRSAADCAPLAPLSECMLTHLCVRVTGAAHGGPVPASELSGQMVCTVLVGADEKLRFACELSEWPDGMRWPAPLLVRVHALSQTLTLQLRHLNVTRAGGRERPAATAVGERTITVAEARELCAQAEHPAGARGARGARRVWCARPRACPPRGANVHARPRPRARPDDRPACLCPALPSSARARASSPLRPLSLTVRLPLTQPGALASAYLQLQLAICDGTRDPLAWATACVSAMGGEGAEVAPAAPAVVLATGAAGAPPSSRRVSVIVSAHKVECEGSLLGRHVSYLLTVALGEQRWEVARRFSDFRRLHAELCSAFPTPMQGASAQMPSKELLPTLRDKALEASRRMPQLQQYVQWLLLNDDTRRSEQLMLFLDVQQRGHADLWLQSVGMVGGANAAALAYASLTMSQRSYSES